MINQIQKLTALLLLWITLPVFLLLTNPETLPLPLLVVPFILLLFVIYKTMFLVLKLSFRSFSKNRIRVMAGASALLPTLLLILASIRQLTVRDTAIVIGLLITLTFYMRRIDFLHK